MNHSSTILVTGASGFVGSQLAKRELERGNRVSGIHHPSEEPALGFASAGIDLKDKETLRNFILEVKPSRVYHLAALSSVRMCQENPVLAFDTNVTGTLNLFDILSELEPKPTVLFTSSCEVYGKVDAAKQPIDETCSPSPVNIYGLSKLTAEELCHYYTKEYGLAVVITRAFNHTGPGQSSNFVFPYVASTLARIEAGREEPVLRMGNLSVGRDYLDARDVVSAYQKIMDNIQTAEIFNVTSGRCILIEEGVRMLIEISGLKVTIKKDESRIRPYDIPRLSGDSSLLEKNLGWRRDYTLERTFADLLHYWRVKEGLS